MAITWTASYINDDLFTQLESWLLYTDGLITCCHENGSGEIGIIAVSRMDWLIDWLLSLRLPKGFVSSHFTHCRTTPPSKETTNLPAPGVLDEIFILRSMDISGKVVISPIMKSFLLQSCVWFHSCYLLEFAEAFRDLCCLCSAGGQAKCLFRRRPLSK